MWKDGIIRKRQLNGKGQKWEHKKALEFVQEKGFLRKARNKGRIYANTV